MFYACHTTRLFWKYIERIIKLYINQECFVLKPIIFLLGYNFKTENLVDLLINYGLLCIYRCNFISDSRTSTKPRMSILVQYLKLLINKRYEIEKLKTKQRIFVNLENWVTLVSLL